MWRATLEGTLTLIIVTAWESIFPESPVRLSPFLSVVEPPNRSRLFAIDPRIQLSAVEAHYPSRPICPGHGVGPNRGHLILSCWMLRNCPTRTTSYYACTRQ